LQRVIRERIVFTAVGDGYTFEAATRFDRLFTGIAVPRPAWIPFDTTGTEHIRPEDRSISITRNCWRSGPRVMVGAPCTRGCHAASPHLRSGGIRHCPHVNITFSAIRVH
jgi:hypothetical protein